MELQVILWIQTQRSYGQVKLTNYYFDDYLMTFSMTLTVADDNDDFTYDVADDVFSTTAPIDDVNSRRCADMTLLLYQSSFCWWTSFHRRLWTTTSIYRTCLLRWSWIFYISSPWRSSEIVVTVAELLSGHWMIIDNSSLPDLTLYFTIHDCVLWIRTSWPAKFIVLYYCLVFAICLSPSALPHCRYLLLYSLPYLLSIYSSFILNQRALEHYLLLLESLINSNPCLCVRPLIRLPWADIACCSARWLTLPLPLCEIPITSPCAPYLLSYWLANFWSAFALGCILHPWMFCIVW